MIFYNEFTTKALRCWTQLTQLYGLDCSHYCSVAIGDLPIFPSSHDRHAQIGSRPSHRQVRAVSGASAASIGPGPRARSNSRGHGARVAPAIAGIRQTLQRQLHKDTARQDAASSALFSIGAPCFAICRGSALFSIGTPCFAQPWPGFSFPAYFACHSMTGRAAARVAADERRPRGRGRAPRRQGGRLDPGRAGHAAAQDGARQRGAPAGEPPGRVRAALGRHPQAQAARAQRGRAAAARAARAAREADGEGPGPS